MKDSNPPFGSVTEKTTVRLPIIAWLSIVAFSFSVGGLWISVRADVDLLKKNYETEVSAREQTDKELRELLTRTMQEVQGEQKMQRDLLIRVDERLKRLSP